MATSTTIGPITVPSLYSTGDIDAAGSAHITGNVNANGGDFINVNATTAGFQDVTVTSDITANAATIGNIAVSGQLIGDLVMTGNLTADDAAFETCEVNSSPVRTFANTPDGPGQGMVWPTNGIPVSLGDHWQDPSINPATLATFPPSGIPQSTGTAWGASIASATLARYPAAGVPVSTGTAWGTPIDPATIARYPAAGIPVSTGTAWTTPIDQSTIAFLNQAVEFQSNVTADGFLSSNTGRIALRANATSGTSGILSGADNTLHIDPPTNGSTFINWGAGVATIFGNGAGVAAARVDSNGAISTGVLVVGQFAPTVNPQQLSVSITPNTGYGNNGLCAVNMLHAGVGPGEMRFGAIAGGLFSFGSSTQNVTTQCYGTFTVTGTKNFQMIHPLDNTKYLTHSCLEGPEAGVFYRGEGQTGADAMATITLPDYFEALTRAEGRTVLLTEMFEDNSTELGKLAASRVKDGKFRVRSEYASQKFFWEVKAVRADVERIEVETSIPDEHQDDHPAQRKADPA